MILDQIEAHYGQSGFESEFRSYFQEYLSDIDPATSGAQQYVNCSNARVATIEQAYWCGPSQTWPQAAHNHAYIDFWHHLDRALVNQLAGVNVDQLGDLGPALLNDDAWTALFGIGTSYFNGITVRLTERTLGVDPLNSDQLGNSRPAGLPGDIGAVEVNN